MSPTQNRYLPFAYLLIVLVTSRDHFIIIYLGWCQDMAFPRVVLRENPGFRWAGGKFTKFVTLVQFYALSFFPCFINSDTNLKVDNSTLAISEVE